MYSHHFSSLTIFIFVTAVNFILFGQEKAESNFSADYAEVANYLFDLKLTGEAIEIESEVTFKKDVGLFKLIEGTLYQCSTYNGIPHSLVFIGKGEFAFIPPNEIERKQLHRFYEMENYSTSFDELFLLFHDGTYEEIVKNNVFKKIKSNQADYFIQKCVEYLKECDVSNSRSDFLRSIMMQEKCGFFYAHIEESVSNQVFFQINPFEFEEITFMKDAKGSALIGSSKWREIVNQFSAQAKTFEQFSIKKPNKYFLDLLFYRIESTIADDLDFSAKCILDFKDLETEQRWVMFYLYEELIVDSVKWEDGESAIFFNPRNSSEVWIECMRNKLDRNQHSITIYYHGDLLEKNELGWIYLKSSIFWYPRYDNHEKAAFGLIFHYPAKYELVSVGDLANKVEQNDVTTSTWFCNTPSRNISFNIGQFEVHDVINESRQTVNVYISEFGHEQISRNLVQYGILSMSDASEFIAQDVANSMALFTELFGEPPFNVVRVTEIPYLHGEAFPSFIHLSWATVIQTNFEGEDEIFRAHETAHQWWGVGVDFDNYHDQWLSEGFAQYSGLLYLQVAKNDNELFFDILDKWKDDILNVRNYFFGSGQEAGPIWLGYRTSSSSTPGDYNLIVYKKGAWVLHMLRGMLLDLNTMNEDKMKKMMKEFYATYRDKNASTSGFKKIVDKHFGEDMKWFFNQYIYGTDIPKYNVAYKAEKTPEGKTIITLRIRQEEVSNDFKMYVPVKIVLNEERVGRIRIEVKGKETIFTTPALEGEVEEIVFNDLESVLCEVNYEDWD
jgi:hypothetical protein